MTVYISTPLGQRDIEHYGVYYGTEDEVREDFNATVQIASEINEFGYYVDQPEVDGGIVLVKLPHVKDEAELESLVGGDRVRLNFELWKAFPDWSKWLNWSNFPEDYFPDDDPYWDSEDEVMPHPPMSQFEDAEVVDQWVARESDGDDVNYADIFDEQGDDGLNVITPEEVAEYVDMKGVPGYDEN